MGFFNREKRFKGDVVISGMTVNGSASASKINSSLEPLYRGLAQDLTYTHLEIKVTITPTGQGHINDVFLKPQHLPESESNLEFLAKGTHIQHGKVTADPVYHEDTKQWKIVTDHYPAGIFYSPGSVLVVASRNRNWIQA